MRYTYTFLNSYKKCHKQAYLQHIKKVIDPSKVNHRNFMVGLVVDWLFGKWISERRYEEDWMELKACTMFNWFAERRHIVYADEHDKERMIKRTIKVCRQLQFIAFDEGFPNEEIETQKKVLYKGNEEFPDFEFYGKIDLWYPVMCEVWDLKVTIQKKYLDENQILFYAWLLQKTHQTVKAGAFLVPELSSSIRPVDIDASRMIDFELELYELLREIQKEEEWLPTAKDCWGCGVRQFCGEEEEFIFDVEKKDKGFRIFVGEDLLK